MKKQVIDLIRGYVKRLSREDFERIHSRLHYRYGGDLGEALQFIQKSPDMDRWLSSAKSADDFYDMVDAIAQCTSESLPVS